VLEGLKALFEVEQPVQGIAADLSVESPHRSTIVDLQEFNQRLRLGMYELTPSPGCIRKPCFRSSRYWLTMFSSFSIRSRIFSRVGAVSRLVAFSSSICVWKPPHHFRLNYHPVRQENDEKHLARRSLIVSEQTTYRGTQTFGCLVPEVQGFRQSSRTAA
jgi:hypothetical protein